MNKKRHAPTGSDAARADGRGNGVLEQRATAFIGNGQQNIGVQKEKPMYEQQITGVMFVERNTKKLSRKVLVVLAL